VAIAVKICGLTRVEDALAAAELGADMIGFVFAPSPRRISLANASAISQSLPDDVARVGVFVNPSPDEVQSAIESCGLDHVQLHGPASPQLFRLPSAQAIAAMPLRSDVDCAELSEQMEKLTQGGARLFLVDSFVRGRWGGTGRVADWELARELAQLFPVMLAGGLNPENVAEAIGRVQPWGVDVSTGVEKAPGKKDRAKMECFIAAARGEGA
jgi:phosphoribosylanthranilate isomerase